MNSSNYKKILFFASEINIELSKNVIETRENGFRIWIELTFGAIENYSDIRNDDQNRKIEIKEVDTLKIF